MKKMFMGVMLLLALLAMAACAQAGPPENSNTAPEDQAENDQAAVSAAVEVPPSPTMTPLPEPTASPVLVEPTLAPPTAAATTAPEVVGDRSGAEEEFVSEEPAVPPDPPMPLPPNAYIETFDGEPAAPERWDPDGWDIVVHSRDIETWYALEPMQAHHGPNCEAPAVTHTVTAYGDALFRCRNHMMTALNASGYGVLYFAPNQLVDLSDKAVISIDVSTYRHSSRDWWDIWITPYEDYVQAPLEPFFPDLMGYPRRTIHIRMPDNPNLFYAEQVDNFEVVTEDFEDEWISYEYVFEPDKARRDTFVFEYDNGRIRFGMPAYELWWVDKQLPVPLDWDKAVVQIGHHSYNPEKSCDYDGSCGPNTWHWDNLIIAPAVPFTIIPSVERFAENDSETLTFRQPAPEGAELRFMGIGADLAVSVDSGRTWIDAVPVEIGLPEEEIADEHFRSYRVAVPAGTQTVEFRGADKWGGVIPWHVRAATIMSLVAPGDG